MYSGKPILNVYSGKGDIVQIAQCSIAVQAGNPESIAKRVKTYITCDKVSKMERGRRGREFVLEHFTYEKLVKKYQQLIEN